MHTDINNFDNNLTCKLKNNSCIVKFWSKTKQTKISICIFYKDNYDLPSGFCLYKKHTKIDTDSMISVIQIAGKGSDHIN